MLHKATTARTAGLRAKYATRGLEQRTTDPTTEAMLLRQLYLAHMEAHRFEEALGVAKRMIGTGVMPDVAEQDAARAHLGLDQTENALAHLRTASRVSPASRRAFHLWTLGSALYLLGRPHDAAGILGRAARWGTTARPLYAAQLALARLAAGEQVRGLAQLQERLEEAPCGQGYGQFVLGDLAYHQGDFDAARRYLEGFVSRTTAGRVALAVSLRAEIAHSKKLLKAMKQR
jgi:tetratricopeptide (TPR) repeat protein